MMKVGLNPPPQHRELSKSRVKKDFDFSVTDQSWQFYLFSATGTKHFSKFDLLWDCLPWIFAKSFLTSREENGKAWISFKKKGEKGIRAHLKEMLVDDGGQPYSVTSSDFELSKVSKKSFVLMFKESELIFKVISPAASFDSIHTKSVSFKKSQLTDELDKRGSFHLVKLAPSPAVCLTLRGPKPSGLKKKKYLHLT